MFGRKHRTAYPASGGGTTVTTHQHHTTRTSAHPHSHHQHSNSNSFMNRLRPRRNTPPTYNNTYSSGPVSNHNTKPSFGRRRKHAHTNAVVGGHGHHGHGHGHAHHQHSTVTGTTTNTGVPARKTSMGDKVSGAMMKLRGSLTGRPGVKGAGTRRMHGTDGRGARRYY